MPDHNPARLFSHLAGDAPFSFPTETEIYLLPDGRVVIADLPMELTPLVSTLGMPEPCEVAPNLPDSAETPHATTSGMNPF